MGWGALRKPLLLIAEALTAAEDKKASAKTVGTRERALRRPKNSGDDEKLPSAPALGLWGQLSRAHINRLSERCAVVGISLRARIRFVELMERRDGEVFPCGRPHSMNAQRPC